MLEGQNTKNKILAAHLGGGPGSQGGAQQGTGARGEQYLDGPARSHTIAAWSLFGTSRAPQQIQTGRNQKTSLTDCPLFRSKRTFSKQTLKKLGQSGPTRCLQKKINLDLLGLLGFSLGF